MGRASQAAAERGDGAPRRVLRDVIGTARHYGFAGYPGKLAEQGQPREVYRSVFASMHGSVGVQDTGFGHAGLKKARGKKLQRPRSRKLPTDTAQRALPQSIPPQPKPRRLWRAAKWGAATFVTVAGLVLGVDGSLGPPWPVDPDIVPIGADPGSPFSLPFSSKNGSFAFAMHNVSIRCLIDHIATSNTQIDDSDVGGPPIGDIAQKDSKNFNCGVQVPANSVSEAKIRIEQTYDLGWLGKRSYTSAAFSWVRTSDGGRWIKGPIY